MAASAEAMLDLWSAVLREGKARMRPLFKHPSVAESASAYIDGLLDPEQRKTGWMRAEAIGDPGSLAPAGGTWPSGLEGGRALRCGARRRRPRQAGIAETLGALDAVLVVDETGFPRQGKAGLSPL
jgi:SRSO17 transposase